MGTEHLSPCNARAVPRPVLENRSAHLPRMPIRGARWLNRAAIACWRSQRFVSCSLMKSGRSEAVTVADCFLPDAVDRQSQMLAPAPRPAQGRPTLQTSGAELARRPSAGHMPSHWLHGRAACRAHRLLNGRPVQIIAFTVAGHRSVAACVRASLLQPEAAQACDRMSPSCGQSNRKPGSRTVRPGRTPPHTRVRTMAVIPPGSHETTLASILSIADMRVLQRGAAAGRSVPEATHITVGAGCERCVTNRRDGPGPQPAAFDRRTSMKKTARRRFARLDVSVVNATVL